MKILMQLQGGSKQFGARSLFEDVQFAVNAGEHIGVIGPNGAGKTTLFKCLNDPTLLNSGKVTTATGLRVGYLAQVEKEETDELAKDYVQSRTDKPLWELERMATGLGIHSEHLEMPMPALSGGYRMRVKLLTLLGQDNHLLLLDEPTNYLDLESLLVLERFLQDFKGGFLLISHDREFLLRTTDHTLEVEAGEITKFNGNIDDYFEQKRILEEQMEKQRLSQAAKRKQIMDFANRFRAKATKARQVQSRLKLLNKMESIEQRMLPVGATIKIPDPLRTGKIVLHLEPSELGYGDEVILKDVKLIINRGDHLGIVGVNGAGKSTLLKSLAGELPFINGNLSWGHSVSIGYFAQHVAENLLPNDTVYTSLAHAAHGDVTPQEIKNLAGSLLFSDDDIHKTISVLSGGEKSRVALGQVLLKKSPVLLLDEPTNHLDFHTVEALTQALHSYPGTLITVSHDRGFISRVATKIIEIRDGLVDTYPGTYDEYVWSIEKGSWLQGTPSSAKKKVSSHSQESNKSAKTPNRGQKKESRKLRAEVSAIEKKMNQTSVSVEKLTQKLIGTSGIEAQEVAKTLNLEKLNLEKLEEQWLSLQEQMS